MEEALRRKSAELEDLKRTYDEYISSSEELEHELEHSLKISDEGLISANRAKSVLQARIEEVETDAKNLRNDVITLRASVENYENQLNGMAGVRKVLEGKISMLEMRVRVAESNEMDANKRLETATIDYTAKEDEMRQKAIDSAKDYDRLQNELRTLHETIDSGERMLIHGSSPTHSDDNTVELNESQFSSDSDDNSGEYSSVSIKTKSEKILSGTSEVDDDDEARQIELSEKRDLLFVYSRDDVQQLKSDNARLESEFRGNSEELESSLNKLQKEKDALSKELSSVQEESMKYRKALEDLMTKFQQEFNSKRSLEQEFVELKEENSELNDALAKSSDEAADLAASLQAIKDESKTQVEQHEKRLTHLKSSVEKDKEEALNDVQKSHSVNVNEWKEKLIQAEKERWNALAHVKREHGQKLQEWKAKLAAVEEDKRIAVEHLNTKHKSHANEMQSKLKAAEKEKEEAVSHLSMKESELVSEWKAKTEMITSKKEEALEEQESRMNAIIVRLGFEKESADTEWRNKLVEAAKTTEAKIVALQDEQKAVLEDLREKHMVEESKWRQELVQEKMDGEAKVSTLQKDHQAAIESLSAKHTTELEEERARGKQYQDYATKLKDKLVQVKYEAEKEKGETLMLAHEQYSESASIWEEKLTESQREKQEALSSAEKERSREISEWETKLAESNRENEEALARAEKERSRLVSEWEAKLANSRVKMENFRRNRASEWERKLAESQKEMKKALTSAEETRSRQVSELEAKLAESHREKQEALESVTNTASNEARELEKKMADTQKEKEEALSVAEKETKRALDSEKKKHQQQVKQLGAEMAQACADVESQLRDMETLRESELAASRAKTDEQARKAEAEKDKLVVEWKVRCEALDKKVADQEEFHKLDKQDALAEHKRLSDVELSALRESISSLEKKKESLERCHNESKSSRENQVRLEVEAATQIIEAEKQTLLTEHVRSSALKEREWRRCIEQLQEEKAELESRMAVTVTEKENEMSTIITRLGYEKMKVEAKHNDELQEAHRQHRERERALQGELDEHNKYDYNALQSKSEDQQAQIRRLEAEAKEATQRHEEDRSRVLRVGEMELHAANERLEDYRISSKDQHSAELTRKESEWKREVARLELEKVSFEDEKELALADITRNHTAVVARMQRENKQLRDSYAQLQQDSAKAAKDYHESLNKERAAMLSKFEADKGRQVEDGVRELRAQVSQLTTDKEEMARSGENKVADAKQKLQSAMKEMELSHKISLEETVRAKESALTESASQHRSALKRLELEHFAELDEMREEHSLALADSERKARLESTRLERQVVMLSDGHSQALAEKDAALVSAASEMERKLVSQAADFAREKDVLESNARRQALAAEVRAHELLDSLKEEYGEEKASLDAEHRKAVDGLQRSIASLKEELLLQADDREQERKSATLHLERELRRVGLEAEEAKKQAEEVARDAYAKLEADKNRQREVLVAERQELAEEKRRDMAELLEKLVRERDVLAKSLSDQEDGWAKEREILHGKHRHDIAELSREFGNEKAQAMDSFHRKIAEAETSKRTTIEVLEEDLKKALSETESLSLRYSEQLREERDVLVKEMKAEMKSLEAQYKANLEEKQRAVELEKEHQLMESESARAELAMQLISREKELLDLIDKLKSDSERARQIVEDGTIGRIDELTDKLAKSDALCQVKEQERVDLVIRDEDRKLLIEEKYRQCELLSARVLELEASLRVLQDEKASVSAEKEGLSTRLEERERDREALLGEIQSIHAKLDMHDQAACEESALLRQDLLVAREELDSRGQDLEVLRSTLNRSTAEAQIYQAENSRLEQELTAATSKVDSQSVVVEELQTQISYQTTTVDALQQKLEESANELELKGDDVARSAEQAWNVELETKLEKMSRQLKKSQSTANDLLEDASEWQERGQKWDKDKERMRKQIDRLVTDLARTRNQLERQIKASHVAEARNRAEAEQVEAELESGEVPDVSSAVMMASKVISSGDLESVAQALVRQTERYEVLREAYSQSLGKLQESRGGIMVCCRLRPQTESEASKGQAECVDVLSNREVALYDRKGAIWRDYGFDKVWRPEATQKEVFSDIEPLVQSLVDGINCCIFAYGPTGSGKTHTIVGEPSIGAQGICYRTLRKLFEALRFLEAQHVKADAMTKLRRRRRDAVAGGGTTASAEAIEDRVPAITTTIEGMDRPGDKADVEEEENADDDADTVKSEPEPEPVPFLYEVHVSMFEIYNENIRDLLGSHSTRPSGTSAFKSSQVSRTSPASLDARTQLDGSIAVAGLKRERARSAEEASDIFMEGMTNRATAHTDLNERSSRSHCLMQVELVTKNRGSVPCKSRLYLVDLAGSERVEKSRATGTILREAQHINRSLAALGDVMEALDQKREHVPFRNSKLTYLLQDALGGNSRTMMVLALSPTEFHAEESLMALQFASRVRSISLGGPASKLVDVKNMEESLRKAKSDLRSERQKRVKLEEQTLQLKKELTDAGEKVDQSIEYRAKGVQEARSGMEDHIKALAAAVDDWKARWTEERNVKLNLLREREVQRREKHGADLSFRDLQNEKDHLVGLLKIRDKEMQEMKLRESLGSSVQASPMKSPLRDIVLRSSMSAAAAAVASAITAEKRTPPPESEPVSKSVGEHASTGHAFSRSSISSEGGRQDRSHSGSSQPMSRSAESADRISTSINRPPHVASGATSRLVAKPQGVTRKSTSPELENPPELLLGMRELTPPQGHHDNKGGMSSSGASRTLKGKAAYTPSIAERSREATRLHKERMEKRRLEKEAAERKKNNLW